jgi:hypothetical protein
MAVKVVVVVVEEVERKQLRFVSPVLSQFSSIDFSWKALQFTISADNVKQKQGDRELLTYESCIKKKNKNMGLRVNQLLTQSTAYY